MDFWVGAKAPHQTTTLGRHLSSSATSDSPSWRRPPTPQGDSKMQFAEQRFCSSLVCQMGCWIHNLGFPDLQNQSPGNSKMQFVEDMLLLSHVCQIGGWADFVFWSSPGISKFTKSICVDQLLLCPILEFAVSLCMIMSSSYFLGRCEKFWRKKR